MRIKLEVLAQVPRFRPALMIPLILIMGAPLLGHQGYAQAQSAATAEPQPVATTEPQLQEINVTAEKTSENIMRVPVAVTAVTATELEGQHITDVQDLASSIPNFNYGTFGGTARLAIRGVGFDSINAGAEGRVAYYVDDVYYSRPASAAGSFFDIDHIEVLRGPQGTLYGRNATGGALNTFSANPTDNLSGYFNETVGNFHEFMEEGAIGGAVSDKVDLRLAFQVDDRDGYGRNTLTNHDVDNAGTQSVRLKAKFAVTDNFTVRASLDYHREDDNNFAGHYGGQAYPSVFPVEFSTLIPISELGAPAPSNIRDVAMQRDPTNHRDSWGANVTTSYALGDMTFKTITAFRHSSYDDYFALAPGIAYPINLTEDSNQVSEELQVSQKTADFHWVAGVYGFHEEIRGASDVPVAVAGLRLIGLPAASSANGYDQGYWAGGRESTATVAVFGQYSYSVTSALEVTAGLRLAWERKDVDDGQQFDVSHPYTQPNPYTDNPTSAVDPIGYYNTQTASADFHSTTPKISITYAIQPDLTTYLTIAKGYKSGGFDLGAVAPQYAPETLWDYEAGVKGDFYEHRLRTSAAVFYYHYTDLQVSLVKDATVFTENAAAARSYGFELETEALVTDSLLISFSGGYLNARFTDYTTSDPALPVAPVMSYAGYTLSQSPEFQGKLAGTYTWNLEPGTVSLRGDVDYTSRVFFTPFDITTASQAANTKINASLEYDSPGKSWHVNLYGRNLTNKTTVSASTIATALSADPLVTYLAPPRTYGISAGYRF